MKILSLTFAFILAFYVLVAGSLLTFSYIEGGMLNAFQTRVPQTGEKQSE